MATPSKPKQVQEFHHMELHPASHKDAAGVMSHTTYAQHAPGQGGGPAVVHETESKHHPTIDHLTSHIHEHMGHLFGEDADREEADGELHRPGHNDQAVRGQHD